MRWPVRSPPTRQSQPSRRRSSLARRPRRGRRRPTPLNRQQILGFWAAWFGWMLDGMDSVIYALVLSAGDDASCCPVRHGATARQYRLRRLDPVRAVPDRLGPVLHLGAASPTVSAAPSCLAATILIFSVFTGAAAFAQNVWELALFRFLAGIGIGGEWAMAGTYVAEAWPEDRRKKGAGYLQTGYYAGFFLAAALNFTVGATFGWRAMFLCGAGAGRGRARSPWSRVQGAGALGARSMPRPRAASPLALIFSGALSAPHHRQHALVSIAIIGLWAGTVYEPTAIIDPGEGRGLDAPAAARAWPRCGTGDAVHRHHPRLPAAARCWPNASGRKTTLALYFAGMAACDRRWPSAGPSICRTALRCRFIAILFFLGFAGGNFAIFSLWLPEQYRHRDARHGLRLLHLVRPLPRRGRQFRAGGRRCSDMGTLGMPVALTAVAFVIGLLIIPFALETRGQRLPS